MNKSLPTANMKLHGSLPYVHGMDYQCINMSILKTGLSTKYSKKTIMIMIIVIICNNNNNHHHDHGHHDHDNHKHNNNENSNSKNLYQDAPGHLLTLVENWPRGQGEMAW